MDKCEKKCPVDLDSRVVAVERQMKNFDFIGPVEMAQFITDKERILNHQAEMKADIKDIKNSITGLYNVISKERIDNMEKLNELEKDLVSVKTKIAVFTSLGSGVGVIIGWVLSNLNLTKG